jgi:hypothetical protein
MEINHSEYTIAELKERFGKDIKINRDYQRGGGVWPETAKVYFIDTILEEYPFPKLYFHQIYDKAKKKPIMEVVDGQQRLLTIFDFMNGEFKLSGASKKHSGKYFSDLSSDEQDKFRMSRVQADVILAAERTRLLEMFRRINAYTAPLNPAEKRHAKYQGKFKWFATEIADKIGAVLEEFEILTTKQMIRMADAEFIAELAIILDSGIVHKSTTTIENIYKKYDVEFPYNSDYGKIIIQFFQKLSSDFSELRGSFLMKTYAVHSLFAAFAHIYKGIPNGDTDLGFISPQIDIQPDSKTIKTLLALADAHESKDENGPFAEYVKAATSTTTKLNQRKTRSRILASILMGK